MPMTLSRALKEGRALSPVRGNAMHEVSVAARALFARHCACVSEVANGETMVGPNHPWRHLAGETLPDCPPSSSESIPGLRDWSFRSRTSSHCWIVSVAPQTHGFRTRDAGPGRSGTQRAFTWFLSAHGRIAIYEVASRLPLRAPER